MGYTDFELAVMFQSTPPHGGRRTHGNKDFLSMDVSIHAPAWGATDTQLEFVLSTESFNPRPRMGGDIANAQQF